MNFVAGVAGAAGVPGMTMEVNHVPTLGPAYAAYLPHHHHHPMPKVSEAMVGDNVQFAVPLPGWDYGLVPVGSSGGSSSSVSIETVTTKASTAEHRDWEDDASRYSVDQDHTDKTPR